MSYTIDSVAIIIPAHNEAAVLPMLLERIYILGKQIPLKEIIIVNDGSRDETVAVVQKINIPLVKLISHEKRLGQSAALRTAFKQVSADIIVTIDADLQNYPGDISTLLAALQYNVLVTGVRTKRKDPVHKTIPSYIANQLLSCLFGVSFRDSGCGLRVMPRKVLECMPPRGNIHRLFPFYAHIAGFEVKEVAVRHAPRLTGVSKYGLGRAIMLFFDIIDLISFSRSLKRGSVRRCAE